MSVWAAFRVKNEQDVIAAVVGRMLTQVDHVIVADGSTDDTPKILAELGVTVIRDDEPTFRQPEQMNMLAGIAREAGADWIVPADGDEVWIADEGRIADRLMELPDEALIASAPLFNHVVTALDDEDDRDPVSRIEWRRPEPVPLRKVACRLRDDLEIHFGQHGATYHGTRDPLTVADILQIRHYPYRSPAQFIHKIELGGPELAKSGLSESIGAHWRGFYETLQRDGEAGLVAWFNEWAYSANPYTDPELVCDPCPI